MPAKSGEGPPFPVFVAEGSSNLHIDWKRCLDFVRSAEEIGCGAVTFQVLRIRKLFAVEAPRSDPEVSHPRGLGAAGVVFWRT